MGDRQMAQWHSGEFDVAANWIAGPAGVHGETQYYQVVAGGALPTVSIAGNEGVLAFNSYSYLGLGCHPKVRQAAKLAIEKYGTSACGVRPVCGTRDIHLELEAEIAEWLGKESALVFSTGYAANESGIASIVGPRDVVVADRYAHRSMRKGFELSGARTVFFEHNDLDDLRGRLAQVAGHGGQTLVCIEGVYSMHGTIPELSAIVEIAHSHGALLYIDEAHSIGALGERGGGICEHQGVSSAEVAFLMGSLSKAIPSIGGYIAGDRDAITMMRFSSSQTIFSAASTPADVAAALAAIRVMQAEPEHGRKLRDNIRYLSEALHRAGFSVQRANQSPVIPLIFRGDNRTAFEFWRACLERGIALNTFYYPVVPKGSFLARIGVMASHERAHLELLVSVLADVRSRARAPEGMTS